MGQLGPVIMLIVSDTEELVGRALEQLTEVLKEPVR